LTLPLHGSGYQELHLTLSLSTDSNINPPNVPTQTAGPHSGNRLDMVGQGQFGSATFWATFRGTITAWPGL
jgi:hypothetical protein